MCFVYLGIHAAYTLRTRRDVAYGAVFVWAIIDIVVKCGAIALVAYTAAGLAAVILVLVHLGVNSYVVYPTLAGSRTRRHPGKSFRRVV